MKLFLGPVGTPVVAPDVELLVLSLRQTWTRLGIRRWGAACKFFLSGLDDVVSALSRTDASGEDKKATALLAASFLYDVVFSGLVPWYLWPLRNVVKNFVVNRVLSAAIDFIADKYRTN